MYSLSPPANPDVLPWRANTAPFALGGKAVSVITASPGHVLDLLTSHKEPHLLPAYRVPGISLVFVANTVKELPLHTLRGREIFCHQHLKPQQK